MAEPSIDAGPGIDPSNLVLLVVGAHLRGEIADRPLAYGLRDRMLRWIAESGRDINVPIVPVVCTDVWYVNQESLHQRPTVSIGGPGVNALSAYYAKNLDQAMLEDHKMVIQLDPEFVHLRVAIWGADHDLTTKALELFTSRYLDAYLRAVATQVEPEG